MNLFSGSGICLSMSDDAARACQPVVDGKNIANTAGHERKIGSDKDVPAR